MGKTAKYYPYDGYDQICFSQYMFLALKPGKVINRSSLMMNGLVFVPGETTVTQIGKKNKGKQSSGFSELRMLPGESLIFAGTFQNYVLFRNGKGFPREKNGLLMGEYEDVFVAYFDFDQDFLCYITSGQASRLVAKEFVLTNPPINFQKFYQPKLFE